MSHYKSCRLYASIKSNFIATYNNLVTAESTNLCCRNAIMLHHHQCSNNHCRSYNVGDHHCRSFNVGDSVTVITRSSHYGEKGTVHSFTPQKVRVLFNDGTNVAYFQTSLLSDQQSHRNVAFSKQQPNDEFRVGDIVTVVTRSCHLGQKGTIHSFTEHKVRVIFNDGKKVAYFRKSLLLEHRSDELRQKHQYGQHAVVPAVQLKALLCEITNLFKTQGVCIKDSINANGSS